jgi:ceramide glucosyltransferase
VTFSLGLPHAALVIGRLLAATLCVTAVGYCAFAVYCAHDFFSRAARLNAQFTPPITILKPVYGLDRSTYENFASFCRQDYPEYQILFGAECENDAGIAVARQVARDFPNLDIRIVVKSSSRAANPKVGTLAALARLARHPFLLVSDSDIRVGPTHLSALARPMADPNVGVVTCLYRSGAIGLAGTLDALGLSTDFQPSVLVARKIEGISFGMGSGTLVRRSALDAAGGFDAMADSLADDYLLGNLPVRAGYRAELAPHVVEHELATSTLRGIVDHQLRWNRGIRAVRPGGYAGLLFTQGVPAGLLFLLLTGGSPAGWAACALTLASRLGMAWFVAVRCLGDRAAGRSLWLVPLRDLLSCALWLAAFFGKSVVWRGNRYRLEAGGRLAREGVQIEAPDSALIGTRAAS